MSAIKALTSRAPLLLLLLCSFCFAASKQDEQLIVAHRNFVKAQTGRNFSQLESAIYFGRAENANALKASFFNLLESRFNAGTFLLFQKVDKVDHFKSGKRQVAFLRVSSEYTNPFSDEAQLSKETVVAFSSDRGKSWQFNVLDCLNSDDIGKFAPGYVGIPSLIEGENH